jgi:hypothetical protein
VPCYERSAPPGVQQSAPLSVQQKARQAHNRDKAFSSNPSATHQVLPQSIARLPPLDQFEPRLGRQIATASTAKCQIDRYPVLNAALQCRHDIF